MYEIDLDISFDSASLDPDAFLDLIAEQMQGAYPFDVNAAWTAGRATAGVTLTAPSVSEALRNPDFLRLLAHFETSGLRMKSIEVAEMLEREAA